MEVEGRFFFSGLNQFNFQDEFIYSSEKCVSTFLLSVLTLLKLSTVLGSLEKRTFLLPVLPEVTYGVDDVIIRPSKSSTLALNATLMDLETNITYCEISTTKEKKYRFSQMTYSCNVTGLALITSTEATVFINISGDELPLLPIYNMGEKYIISEDFDGHRTDHINSLLIYTTAKNTTVSVCFDQKRGGHLSEQFSDQLNKWIDGELQCYRKTLGRCEIWMINNASVHRGIEIIANNPIGVLQCHSTNSSFSLRNGRFIDGPQHTGMKIVWEGYPPLKFWGKQFILFPGNTSRSQSITVIAEKDTLVFLNSSTVQRTISLQGRLRVSIVLEQSQWITLNSSSKLTVSSLYCDGTYSYNTIYHTPVDSTVWLENKKKEEDVRFILVCTRSLGAWIKNDETRKHFTEKGNLFLGNQKIYFAFLTEINSLQLLNFSGNGCLLTRTIESKSCWTGMNYSFYRNEAGTSSTISVPFNDSHLTNVSGEDLIDRSSRVVIGVHKNDNVNKSSNGNFSDMGLKGNKTEFIHNRSDKQIAINRTRFSLLETMKTSSPRTMSMTPLHAFSKGQTDMVSLTSDIRGNRSENSSTTRVPFSTQDTGYTNYQLNELTIPTDNEERYTPINADSTDRIVSQPDSSNTHQITTTTVYMSKKPLSTSNINSLKSNLSEIHKYQNSKMISNDTSRMISKIKKLLNTSEIKETSHDLRTTTLSNVESELLSNDSRFILRKGYGNINRTSMPKKTYNWKAGNKTQDKASNNTKEIYHKSNNSSSRKTDKLSNDRFKVVVDIVSSGNKNININPRVRYENKNPTYVNFHDDRGKLEQVGDGKSLVAVIVSLSSAVFAVIAIILVFFFIEYFSRRKQLRKTRIRPFLSDY